MSRIGQTFTALKAQNKKALIPFITAGDPGKGLTVPLMHALVEAGADIIELGVPFSDPMADGPVIQRASERALANKVGLHDVLAMTAEFRKTNTTTPVVLMGYANPVEHMGYETFAQAAKAAGVDGVLTVDIPPEESAGVSDVFKAHGLDPIFLLSPTTPESRVEQVAAVAGGFIYYVSLKGVTGSANLDMDEVAQQTCHHPQALQPAGRRGLRHPRRGDRRGGGADCRRGGGGQPHRERDRDRAGRRVRQPRQDSWWPSCAAASTRHLNNGEIP